MCQLNYGVRGFSVVLRLPLPQTNTVVMEGGVENTHLSLPHTHKLFHNLQQQQQQQPKHASSSRVTPFLTPIPPPSPSRRAGFNNLAGKKNKIGELFVV